EEKFEEYITQLEEGLNITNIDMITPYISEKYLSNILNYFKDNAIVYLDESKKIEENTKDIKEQFLMKYSDALEAGEVLPGHVNINYEYGELIDKLEGKICLLGSSIAKIDNKFSPVSNIRISSKTMQSFHNNMELLNKELNYYKYRG